MMHATSMSCRLAAMANRSTRVGPLLTRCTDRCRLSCGSGGTRQAASAINMASASMNVICSSQGRKHVPKAGPNSASYPSCSTVIKQCGRVDMASLGKSTCCMLDGSNMLCLTLSAEKLQTGLLYLTMYYAAVRL